MYGVSICVSLQGLEFAGGGGGAKPSEANFNTWGGGGYCQKYIYACVHMHMYAHTCVKYSNTHVCTAYANIHFTLSYENH